MNLLLSKNNIELPFRTEHIETYALSDNKLLILSEEWDYMMFDCFEGKVVCEGKFPEDED